MNCVWEQIKKQDKNEYKRLIRELRETYALHNVTDEKLVEALRKANGKVEEALASLF